MAFGRMDPGPCPICGAAHTACTGATADTMVINQLPARGELALAVPPPELPAVVEFSTATYDRSKHNPAAKKKPR